jgi:signal transduction histidine kinase
MAVLEEVVAQTNVLRAEQQAAVFAETEAARRAMWEVPLAWGLLIAIAALSTTAIAIRSIAQPVERLTEVAQRLAGGNLEERVQIEWADEFGRLATAFNEMADQLQVSYAGLEQRVAERTAELEQANEEVKQFAYIVSHDLRAPLTNLKGFSEELCYALEVIGSAMDTALPHLDEKQRQAVTTALQKDVPEALGFIDSSVTRMDHFINALLKLSRLGRRELDLKPIDMNALAQETLKTLAHQIEERQVSVTVGPLPEVVADRTSMAQIMGNLIEVAAERDHEKTTLHVRDNGRGIAEEDMPKVFAPFRRAGKQDVPGEGMGLAYVQTLVRRHGGRIWCESEQGVGTTFTFTVSNHLVRGERGDTVME